MTEEITKREIAREAKLLVIYGLVFIYFIFKMFYYMEQIWYVPDEEAHVSYIAYLEEHPDKIIPEFENISLYGGGVSRGEPTFWYFNEHKVCYLGHPPLYYHMMKLVNATDPQGEEMFVDLYPLKLANIVLTSFTMLIIFYFGYSRMKRFTMSGFYHGVFAVAATSVPMLALCGSGITNDNLSNLGVILFLIGIFRYYEEKINYGTYFLVALGFFLSIMSKLTTGEMLVIILAVIFLAELIRNRNLKLIINKYFLASLPIYLIAAAYFFIILKNYGSIQPGLEVIAPQELNIIPEAEREVMDFPAYIKFFFTNFGYTWGGIYNGRFYLMKTFESFVRFPFYLMAGLCLIRGIVGLIQWIRKKDNYGMIYTAAVISLIITITTQFFNGYRGFIERGYTGGYQARYYLCMIPILAFACGEIFGRLDTEKIESASGNRKVLLYSKKTMLKVLAAAFIIWMLYSDFLYFLTVYNEYKW